MERFGRNMRSDMEFSRAEVSQMDGIIYLVGLVVVVMAILSFLGLH